MLSCGSSLNPEDKQQQVRFYSADQIQAEGKGRDKATEEALKAVSTFSKKSWSEGDESSLNANWWWPLKEDELSVKEPETKAADMSVEEEEMKATELSFDE